MMSEVKCVWVVALAAMVLMETLAQTIIKKQELNVTSFNDRYCNRSTSGDQLYYRYLQPSTSDPSVIYVGAMNFLYKLKKDTLQCVKHKEYTANYDDYRRCTIQGKTGIPDCQNHIRVVMEINNQLTICGTGAYAPTKYTLNSELNYTDLASGIAICPYDPFDNYTALVVNNGNPGNATVPYFGTYTDFIKSSPVFYRPKFTGVANNITYTEKTTDREDIAWLNYPQFVGSFDDTESVLFFFRETALEYQASRNKMYSRVGKVCKHDLGGGYMDVAKKKWLSFQKARLVCSLPGSDPFYFDDIYDVFESGDRFYALFFKQGADLSTSAICVFKKSDIITVFAGKFKYRTNYGTWETVPDNLNPNPRLDNCEAHRENPDVFKDQVSRYQLMDQNVNPLYGKPVYYRSGVQLVKIVVGNTKINGDTMATNIYAASDRGEVYDIFLKEFVSQTSFIQEHNLIYRPFDDVAMTNKYAVWSMKIMDNTLLLGTDYEVSSLRLDNICGKLKYKNRCVMNTYCRWCANACVSEGTSCSSPSDWSNISQDGVKSIILSMKPAIVKDLPAVAGLYTIVYLETDYDFSDIVWAKNFESNRGKRNVGDVDNCAGVNILEGSDKYAATSTGDLIIRNITDVDNGTYIACDAQHRDIPLTVVNVKVVIERDPTSHDSIVTVWKQQFNEWSSAFKRWKNCADNFYSSSCPANNNG